MLYTVVFRVARRLTLHLLRRAGYDVPPVRQLRPRRLAREALRRRAALRRRVVRAVRLSVRRQLRRRTSPPRRVTR